MNFYRHLFETLTTCLIIEFREFGVKDYKLCLVSKVYYSSTRKSIRINNLLTTSKMTATIVKDFFLAIINNR
jgi:hypothetical protein